MSRCGKFLIHILFKKRTIGRFLGALIEMLVVLFVFAVGIAAIALVIDHFDVAKRALSAFAPYSSVVPWAIATGLIVYLIHLPGVLHRLLNLLDRIRSIGSVAFDPLEKPQKYEPEDMADLLSSAVVDALRKSGYAPLSSTKESNDGIPDGMASSEPQSEVDKTLDSLARARQRGEIVLRYHAERFGNVPWKPQGNDRFVWRRFDGLAKRGSDIVVMEYKPIRTFSRTKASLVNSIYEWNAIKDRLRSYGRQNLSFEILFCADESFRRTSAFDDMIQKVIGSTQPDIHVYLYRFTQTDTIKDSEEIR